MTKIIKISIIGKLRFDSKAEVIRFKADDGTETDCIKSGGRIIQPCLDFLQFHSKEIVREKYGKSFACETGMWISVDDSFLEEHLLDNREWWCMDEKEKKSSD